MPFPFIADMARWDCTRIPFNAAETTCITVVGDWSHVEGEDPSKTIPRIVDEAKRRTALRPDATWAMLDVEYSPLLARYAEITTALRAAIPHKFLVWVNRLDQLTTEYVGQMPGWNAVLMPECYQQKAETPAGAQADILEKVNTWTNAYPSIPMVPCLSVETATHIADYPPSAGPLCSASNLKARIEAVWALRPDYPNLAGLAVWGGALVQDNARAAAIAQIGSEVRSTVTWLRSTDKLYKDSKALYDSIFGARP